MIDTATLFILIICNLLFIECILTEQNCNTLECIIAYQNLGYVCFMLGVFVLLYSVYLYTEQYCKKNVKNIKTE